MIFCIRTAGLNDRRFRQQRPQTDSSVEPDSLRVNNASTCHAPRTIEAQDVGVAQVRLDLNLAPQHQLLVVLQHFLLEQCLPGRGACFALAAAAAGQQHARQRQQACTSGSMCRSTAAGLHLATDARRLLLHRPKAALHMKRY